MGGTLAVGVGVSGTALGVGGRVKLFELQKKLSRGEATCGLWVRLASSETTEIAADVGLDWVCLDMEHGHLGWDDIHRHLCAAEGTKLSVIVRIPAIALEPLKRALDLGADAALLPLVRSAEEVRWAVDMSRYPRMGHRTLGQERATRWGLRMAEYVSAIGDGGLVIPIIETEDALVSIAEILRVDGVQAIFIGTGDLSAARGRVGQWLAPEVRHDVEEVQRCAQEKGIAVGIVASASADIAYCRESGVRMLGLGYDTDCLIAGMQQRMATAKGNGERV